MQIYHFLPRTTLLVGDNTLKGIQAAVSKSKQTFGNQLITRVDVVKLAICSLVDAVVHTGAAIGKFTVAYIQLPGHPIWGGVSTRIALRESGTHLNRAIKSIVAAVLVPIPALVSPNFALTSYRWLALAPKDGIFKSVCHDICIVAKILIAPRHAKKAVIGLALAIATVVGYRHFTALPTQFDRRIIAGGLLAATAVIGLVGYKSNCCTRAKRRQGKKAPQNETQPQVQPTNTNLEDTPPRSVDMPQVPEEISQNRPPSAQQDALWTKIAQTVALGRDQYVKPARKEESDSGTNTDSADQNPSETNTARLGPYALYLQNTTSRPKAHDRTEHQKARQPDVFRPLAAAAPTGGLSQLAAALAKKTVKNT